LSGRLVPVATYTTRGEAEIVQSLLGSTGIDASVSADDAGGAYPFVLSGGAQLLGDEVDVEAASEVQAGEPDSRR